MLLSIYIFSSLNNTIKKSSLIAQVVNMFNAKDFFYKLKNQNSNVNKQIEEIDFSTFENEEKEGKDFIHGSLKFLSYLLELSESEGYCHGFSMMWIHALFSKEFKAFYERLNHIAKFTNSFSHLFLLVNKFIQAKDKIDQQTPLTPEDRYYIDILMFYICACLHQDPEFFPELLNYIFIGQGEKDNYVIYQLIQSILKEQKPVYLLEGDGNIFNRQKLTNYLHDLALVLLNSTQPIENKTAFLIHTGCHAVSFSLADEAKLTDIKWKNFDINKCGKNSKTYPISHLLSTEELVNQIFTSYPLRVPYLKWLSCELDDFENSVEFDENNKYDIYFTITHPNTLKIKFLTFDNPPIDVVDNSLEVPNYQTNIFDIELPDEFGNANNINQINERQFQYFANEVVREVIEPLSNQLPSLLANELCLYFTIFSQDNSLKLREKLNDLSQQYHQLTKDYNYYDKFGNGLLHEAVAHKNFNLVKLLCKKKIDIHHKNKDGMTPFLLACCHGEIEIANHLICLGANIHDSNNQEISSLQVACKHGHANIIKLLLDKGALVNYIAMKNEKETALMVACCSKFTTNKHEIFKILLTHGAELTLKNEEKQSALDLAAQENNSTAILEILAFAQNHQFNWFAIMSLNTRNLLLNHPNYSEFKLYLMKNRPSDCNHSRFSIFSPHMVMEQHQIEQTLMRL